MNMNPESMALRLRFAALLTRGHRDRAWVVARHTAQVNARLVDALREIGAGDAVGYTHLQQIAQDALRREGYVLDRGARG